MTEPTAQPKMDMSYWIQRCDQKLDSLQSDHSKLTAEVAESKATLLGKIETLEVKLNAKFNGINWALGFILTGIVTIIAGIIVALTKGVPLA